MPETYSALLKNSQPTWEKGLADFQGQPSLVAYIPMRGEMGDALGWKLLLVEQQSELRAGILQSLGSGVALVAVVVVVCIIYAIWAVHFISSPITAVARSMKTISRGALKGLNQGAGWDVRSGERDEIGLIKHSMTEMIEYLQEMALVAARIATL